VDIIVEMRGSLIHPLERPVRVGLGVELIDITGTGTVLPRAMPYPADDEFPEQEIFSVAKNPSQEILTWKLEIPHQPRSVIVPGKTVRVIVIT
jgi:hypothetical protein